jgi:ferredoxin
VIQISVDMAKCQHYGQCVFEAPTIFNLNDDDLLEFIASADSSELPNVESAADVCPMQAISFVQDDTRP